MECLPVVLKQIVRCQEHNTYRADAPPGWLASLVTSRPPLGMVWKLPRCRLRGETGGRPGLLAASCCSCAPVSRCSSARSFASEAFSPAGPFDTDASRAGSIAAPPPPSLGLSLLPPVMPCWVWLLGACEGTPGNSMPTVDRALSTSLGQPRAASPQSCM